MSIFAFILIIGIVSMIVLLRRFSLTFSERRRFDIVDNMLRKKDYVGAIKYLEDMKKTEPKNVDIYRYLAVLYEKKRMFVRAVKCYDRLLELNHPDNEHNKLIISKRLSAIYKELKLYDKYFIENMKIIEIDPNDKSSLYEIGYFLAGIGEYDRAIEYLEHMVKIQPDHKDALFYLALCYLSKRWFKEGRDTLEKVLSIEPENGQAYFFLGFIHKEYKSPEAIKTFEEALDKLQDEDYRIKAAIADAVTSIQQNMIDIAITILNQYMSYIDVEDDRRRGFLYNLGWAYFFKGDMEAAISNWEEVSSIDMNYENVSELMNPAMNSNFEEMEREYSIYASKISYPTAREYIGFTKVYDLSELEQVLALWKQKMVSIAKERGVYMGPVKTARVFASLSKIKFKNTAHKMVTSLGYIIEKEFIYQDGVDFIAYKRSARKQDKIFFRIRKWADIIPVENINQFNQDIRQSGVPVKNRILVTCGKYSKKAKDFAEKYNIKLYDERIVTNILSRVANM